MKKISYKAGKSGHRPGMKSLAAAVALMLAAGSLGGVFAAPAEIFAAGKTADTANTPKEEVIYGSLAADGSVEEVNAVNIFDLSEKTKVVDYGSYSSVRNMTTTDKIRKKDGKITVTADVTDFEMDAIQINGVRMNMNLDVDTSSFDGKISQITDAVASADDGAGSLSDGASALHEATGMLAGKTGDLVSGSSQLSSGAADLSGGLSELSGKGSDLNAGAEATYEKLCQSAASQINSMLKAAGMPEISLTPATYAKTLTALSSQLSAAGQSEAASQVQQVKASLDQYGEFYSGLKSYTEGVDSAASGAASLQKNLGTLQSGASSLQSGARQLDQAAGKLAQGASQLKSGTSRFRQKTSRLDAQISDVIDEMVSSVTGKNVAVKSFVSAKNTEIKSVQFVLKTEPIEK